MFTERDRETAACEVGGTIELPGTFESVPKARRYVRTVLGPKSDDVELAVSELVTNAVAHSESGRGGVIKLRLAVIEERVRVEVSDQGSRVSRPRVASNSADTEHGNGLKIVRAVSSRWGVHTTTQGTTVWCEWAPS
jgi:anti-sigma regulatory factor (Ser/Thr protein kinase)